MPSLGIHLSTADAAFSRLQSSKDSSVRSLRSITSRFPREASLGAIGPDLMFYLGTDPETTARVADVLHYLNQISNLIGEAGKLAQQQGMPNVGNRINQLSDTVRVAVGTAQSGLLAAVVELHNVVSGGHLFKITEQQEEKSESDWNWGDILHDRISGSFASQLMARARALTSYSAIAYATGYMSHVATDFVGHAYVNTVVGGPARGWNMRHTVAEKFMDASVFARAGQDINNSRLHSRFSSLADTPELDGLCKLLADLIAATANNPSKPHPLPVPCSSGDLKKAFDSMCSLFRLVTEDMYVPPPRGPGISIPPLPGQYGTLTSQLTGMLPSGGGPRSLTDWLKLLLAFLLAVPAILADLTKFITDVALGLATYPMAAATYIYQSFLYGLYREVRWFLVISGVCFPCLDELTSPLALQFTQISRNPMDGSYYPHVPPKVSKATERVGAITFQAYYFDYLSYPTTAIELPSTYPSPFPNGMKPEEFMYSLPRDDRFVAGWLGMRDPSWIKSNFPRNGGFGNAADLTVHLLENPTLAEMINMDSDRGYGYRQWRCDPGGIGSGVLVNERFI